MKYLLSFLMALTMVIALPMTVQAEGGFKGESFKRVIYVKGTATGGSGRSYDSPKPFVDGDLWDIPAGVLIEKVYVIIDTAITGTTNFDVGDDDDADGFIDGSLSVTLGSTGMYGWSSESGGVYLKEGSGNAPDAKFYSASGKEVKLDVTGTNTAGRARVVVEGFYFK